jgi:hypothetical protein
MVLATLAAFPCLFPQAQTTSPIPAKLPPYTTPQPNGEFLARMLAVAKHNNLADVAFTQSVFGPNVQADKDGHKDLHPSSGLDLIGSGPGTIAVRELKYYYSIAPIKNALNLWRADPLFVGEFGITGIDKYMCINGRDVSNVFRSDPNVGLVNPGSHTFNVAQAANAVTQIKISGPVEDDQPGCVTSVTITEKHMSEFVPEAAGGQ